MHIDNGLLTISGRVHTEAEGEALREEFRLLNFWRQFELGDTIDQNKISAEMKNGVLRLTLPLAEAVKPRTIPINAE